MSQSTSSSPAACADLIKTIDALLQPLCRGDEPGMVVGINWQGRSLYRRGFGLASIEQGVANQPSTRMRLASTSKHFTALAVLLLAEDGLLDIDDPVYRHLPELPVLHPAGPTLRQLMTHTGGWRGHDELWVWANGLALQPPGTSLAMMARQSELNFEPGTRMIYSNGGYRLLALTVERLSGLSFADFLRTRIFEPLGMLDSESVPSVLDVRPGLAGLYLPVSGTAGPNARWTRALYPTEFEGSGSLVSTVGDMLRWLAHLRGERKTVGSAQTWAQMLAPGALSSCEPLQYGCGLVRHPYRGVEVVHHNGAILGGGSQMLSVPAHGLDISIMTNGCAAVPAAVALKLIDLVLAEQLPEAAESLASRIAAGRFAGLLGKAYHHAASGALMCFSEVAGLLSVSLHGSHAVPLRKRGENVGWIGVLDMAINPFEVELGEADAEFAPPVLVVRDGGELLHFERLAEAAPEAAALAPGLCGLYRSADLAADAQIELQGSELTLSMQGRHGQIVFHLEPVSAEVLLARPLDPQLAALANRNVLTLDRGEGPQGSVLGLRIDSVRTRHMRFAAVV